MKDEKDVVELTPAVDAVDKKSTLETIVLKKPVEYNGIKYEKLEFDFDKLTGKDLLSIGAELRAQGKVATIPVASNDFLAVTAIRACTAEIGVDIYAVLSFYDATKIETMTRNFMLGVE